MGKSTRIVPEKADRCWSCNAALRPDQRVCMRCGATRGTSHMQAAQARQRQPEPAMARRYGERGYPERARDQRSPYTGRDAGRDRRQDMRNAAGGLLRHRADTGLRSPVDHRGEYRPFDSSGGLDLADEVDAGRSWPVGPSMPSSARMTAFPKRRNPYPTIPRWTRQKAVLLIAASNVLWPVTFAAMGAFIGGTIWCYVSLTMHFDAGFLAIVMGFLTGEGVTMTSGERGIRPFMLTVALAFAGWVAGEYILHAQGIDLLPLDGAYLFATLVAAVVPIGSLPARKP